MGSNHNFSSSLLNKLNLAYDFALRKKFSVLTIDMFILFIVNMEDIKKIFTHYKLDYSLYYSSLIEYLNKNVKMVENKEIEVSIDIHDILKETNLEKKQSSDDVVTEQDIFVRLFDSSINNFTVNFLKSHNISKRDIEIYFKNIKNEIKNENQKMNENLQFINKYTINLNNLANQNAFDDLIGREKELEQLMSILCQKKKSNPLLLGDPGVGKTAIVEGLAKKLIKNEVPNKIKDFVIYSLDFTSLFAGTRHRGDLEERLKGLTDELSKNKNIILFIDEIHNIIGSNSNNTMDISNLLKPSLANGDLKVIGATSFKDYKDILEKHVSVTRRFQRVEIDEPNKENTLKILNNIKINLEKFHNVQYEENILNKIYDLTQKYLPDFKFPDKAVDILDQLGAKKNMIESVDRTVYLEDVLSLLSEKTKIPLENLNLSEKQKLRNLENKLNENIFGQKEIINKIVDSILLSKMNIITREKTIANFLFAGSTGVGKTELAKQLAKQLDINFIRLDMSEYMEKHSVSKIIGSPPGYIGYSEGGQLTEQIRRNPHCVLLLDEIEKANIDVLNILLQVMDYGKLTDSEGRKIDFTNVILIMSSNVGVSADNKKHFGFGESLNNSKENRLVEIKKFFTPEFFNRLDKVLLFNKLDEISINSIIEKELNLIKNQLLTKNINLTIQKNIIDFIREKSFDENYGARPIKKYIEENVSSNIAKSLLFLDDETPGNYSLFLENSQIKIILEKEIKEVLDKPKIIKKTPINKKVSSTKTKKVKVTV